MQRIGRTKQMGVGQTPTRRGRSRRKRASWAIGSALVLASVRVDHSDHVERIVRTSADRRGFVLDGNDLRFILTQIQTAEAIRKARASCASQSGRSPTLCAPGGLIHEPRLPFGLRTVDSWCDRLLPGQEKFGRRPIRSSRA